MTLARA
jgi:hypothetical protein